MSRTAAPAPPPIARATLTVAALGVLLAAQEIAGARLDVGTDGWLAPATREWPIDEVVDRLSYVTTGWLLVATLAWLVLRVARRRVSWEDVAAALGAALWPTAIAAGALLVTTLVEGPATPFVAFFWASALVSAGAFARALARLRPVGVRGAAAVIVTVLGPLAVATWWFGRFWLLEYHELAAFGVPS